MTAATPTGAELRARRERLGLSVEDAADSMLVTAHVDDIRYMEDEDARGLADAWPRSAAAYAAALAAEEARRAPAEPVPPEGVRLFREGPCVRVYSSTDRRGGSIARVDDDGTIRLCPMGDDGTPVEHIEYVAALSRYRAAQHAAGDRQRKLDAVKAAEDALEEARAAYRSIEAARAKACADLDRLRTAMFVARKEVDLP